MFIKPQARGDFRALVGAAALGSTVGLAIGGAYLAGGMARDAVVHAQIQRLAGTASTGFSQVALDASTATDPGALAIARRHDLLAQADLDPRERRVASLIERLRAGKGSTLSVSPVSPAPSSLALAMAPNATPLTRARFAAAGAASPFQLRGALDESRDLECLAQAVYYEARGETPGGQAAVAQVVLNRVRHPAFPKSICGVVFQGARTSGCQFSFACDGSARHPMDSLAWRRAEKVAAKALDGGVMSEVGNATHFHVAGLNAGWGPNLLKVAQVGSHIFYRFGGHAGAAQMFHGDVQPSEPKAVEVKPVFASFVPSLPSAQQTGQAFAAGAAAVERAANAVENAAKAAVSSQQDKAPAKPAAAVPAAAPTVSTVEPVRTQGES